MLYGNSVKNRQIGHIHFDQIGDYHITFFSASHGSLGERREYLSRELRFQVKSRVFYGILFKLGDKITRVQAEKKVLPQQFLSYQ